MDKIEKIMLHSKHLTLLYVEDNLESRESTLLILEEFFDNIIVAVDGADGYQKFQENENEIDLILTDINMPRLNGLGMIKKILEIKSGIPTIILSAHDESRYLIESIDLGVNNFLFKPMNINKLLDILEKIIENLALIYEAKANLQLLQEYHDVMDKSSIVSKTNLDGVITYVNDKFCKVSAYDRDEIIGKTHYIIKHPDNSSPLYEDIWKTIQNSKQVWRGIMKNLSKNQEDYYLDSTIKPIMNNQGEIVEYISLQHDVSELINLNNQINSLHAYDEEQQNIAREKLEVGIVNHFNEDEAKIIYVPLDILSGDFYSLYKSKNGSTFLYIIDGQGHGISPALTVFSVSSTVNNLIDSVSTLEELVEKAFPIIKTFLGEIEQLSFTIIMISEDSKTISYTSGGMYPFLIKTPDEIVRIKANNTPFMNFSPNPIVNRVDIGEWDSIVAYSDGLVEHKNSDLDEFNPEKLINEPSLINSAMDIISKSDLDDDITVLYLKNSKD